MGKIKIDDVRLGMVLADDVKNHRGLVLLRTGDRITQKDLRIFRMWGITEVDVSDSVKQSVDEHPSQLDVSRLKQVEKEAQVFFSHTDRNHPAIEELFQQYILRTARKKSPGKAHAD